MNEQKKTTKKSLATTPADQWTPLDTNKALARVMATIRIVPEKARAKFLRDLSEMLIPLQEI